MNGNFGRSTCSGGTTATHHHPQMCNGYVLGGVRGNGHCFSRRMGYWGTRPFCTGRASYNRSRPQAATQPHTSQQQFFGLQPNMFNNNQQYPPMPPQMVNHQYLPPPPMMQPHTNFQYGGPVDCFVSQPTPNNHYHVNPQGFINGIKKIVNGFIHPNLNYDFYSDHHRYYNPKYRKNYMLEKPDPTCSQSPRWNNYQKFKTVVVDVRNMNANPPNLHRPAHDTQPTESQPTQEPVDPTFGFTIFTSEDFPALPAVKKQVNTKAAPPVSKVSNKLPRRRRKCRESKPLPIEEPAARPVKAFTCEDFVVLPKPKSCDPTNQSVNSVTCNSPVDMAGIPWPRNRVRQMSECSDDSFVICFSDEAREGVLEIAHDSNEDSDSDLISSSSDDDEEIDETDNHMKVPDVEQFDSGFSDKRPKKVRFNLKPEVHVMHKWDFAYRAARKGHWENFVRDRDRFKKRMECVSIVLNPVLDTQHREKIYRTRFCDNDQDAKLIQQQCSSENVNSYLDKSSKSNINEM